MSRDAGAAISFLVGLVTIRLAASTQMQFYVKTGMRPLLIAAGVLLVALGAGAVWLRGRRREEAAPGGTDGAGGDGRGEHDHHGATRIGWAVLAPMAALMLIAPAPLGAFAAERSASRPPPPPVAEGPADPAFPPLEPEIAGAVNMTMSEFIVRALYDDSKALEDRPVRMTGFVTPRTGGGFNLTRFTLSCCAADARPLKVAVLTDDPPPATETWVEVVGEWVPQPLFDAASTEEIPEVAVRLGSLSPIDAPEQPYEY